MRTICLFPPLLVGCTVTVSSPFYHSDEVAEPSAVAAPVALPAEDPADKAYEDARRDARKTTEDFTALIARIEEFEGVVDDGTQRTLTISDSRWLTVMCEGKEISFVFGKESGVTKDSCGGYSHGWSGDVPFAVQLDHGQPRSIVNVTALCGTVSYVTIAADRRHAHLMCPGGFGSHDFDMPGTTFVYP